MESENSILDETILEVDSTVEPQHIISLSKFIVLSIVSLGLYTSWWQYKAWRFYKQKEKADIAPAARVIFSLFFIYSLFNKIQQSAAEKGYLKKYSAGFLFAGIIVVALLSQLPSPFGVIISLTHFLFFIPPFKALNYAKENSTDINIVIQDSFNGRQIGIIIVGLLFWILLLIGLSVPHL